MERALLIESVPARWRGPLAIVLAIGAGIGLYFLGRLYRDDPVTYSDPVEHFKYGSTGGERSSGFPYAVWQAMPSLFAEYLPGKQYLPETPYASLGFLYEKDPKKGGYKDLPVGVQRRNVQGLDRVFLNCAICHTGSVRASANLPPHLVAGMPSNTVNLQEFQRFLFASAMDERFTPGRILNEIERMGALDELTFLNERLLRKFGISLMRERILLLRDRFKFMDQEPDFGPGRVDTFGPGKVLLNFPMDLLPERERVGICDFPSVWMQGAKDKMQLHWDGNNTSTEERNRNAAFGTGANPGTLDRPSLARMVEFLKTAEPPKFEDFFKADLPHLPPQEAKKFKLRPDPEGIGKKLYIQACANCHGTDGRSFEGKYVGKVEPIKHIGTDRWRLDSFTAELVAPMNQLYAGYGKERFSHFSKTFGYANLPLDGVWLRAPYLHNGSVPTLRDLLEPAANRPKVFYRGYDVYDPVRGGFVSNVAVEPESAARANPQRAGRRYFPFDTRAVPGHQTAAFAKVLEIDRETRVVTLDRPLIRAPKVTRITAPDGKLLLWDIPVEKSALNESTLTLKEVPEELKTGGGLDYSTPRERNDGNSNVGHEYGTNLTSEEKDRIVEYLKTF